jgi:hypothetical protein
LIQVAFFCVTVLFLSSGHAGRAVVTDVSGQTYEIRSLRLTTGSKLAVVCGGTRLNVPFKTITAMKIDPSQITSVDGRMHYGVEIEMRDGTVIGNILETTRCTVGADNGLRGRNAKARFSTPFNKVSGFQVLGKGDGATTKRGEDEEGDEEDE